jgi:hypothetical protein
MHMQQALFDPGGAIAVTGVIMITLLASSLAAADAERGEIAPPASLPCFPGAIYRKAVSSRDVWTGIEGIVTLPAPVFDPQRTNPKTGRPLDNPSIYLGGRAGQQEIDAGVSWELVKEPDGSVSAQRKAFRPFWRNEKWHSGPAQPEYYYHPGDTLRMSVATREPGKLVLEIALLHRAGTPTPARFVDAEPISVLSVPFDAAAFGPGKVQEFKRVNAIDQSGNEGKPAQPTRTTVSPATWHAVHLLRGSERRPMTLPRFSDMRCPDPALVHVEPVADPTTGGETITLGPRDTHGAK